MGPGTFMITEHRQGVLIYIKREWGGSSCEMGSRESFCKNSLLCTSMLVAALFIIAKTRKQPKRPLIDEWTKTCGGCVCVYISPYVYISIYVCVCIYTHTKEYYSAIKRMK